MIQDTPLIHCLAGQGRTGTLIAVLDMIHQNGTSETELIEATKKMRSQRPFMIERKCQFDAVLKINSFV